MKISQNIEASNIQIIQLTPENIRMYRWGYMDCLIDGFKTEPLSEIDFDRVFLDKFRQGHIMLAALNANSKVVSIATLIPEVKFLHGGSVILHVEDVCTKIEYRRLGYSKAIFKEIDKIAREKIAYKIILDCSDENIDFYVKLGFVRHENCMRKNI